MVGKRGSKEMKKNSVKINSKQEVNEMEKRKREITDYIEICPECKKEIVGSSPASATNNLRVHLLTQHSITVPSVVAK